MLSIWNEPFRDFAFQPAFVRPALRNSLRRDADQDRYELIEREDEFLLRLALPGIAPGEVNVQAVNGLLTVEAKKEDKAEEEKEDGRKQYGQLTREYRSQFRLGNEVDTEHISGNLENGVLELVLPRKAETKPRKIELNGGGTN